MVCYYSIQATTFVWRVFCRGGGGCQKRKSSYDLLEANGTARVRQVVEDVKAMCQAAQAMNA